MGILKFFIKIVLGLLIGVVAGLLIAAVGITCFSDTTLSEFLSKLASTLRRQASFLRNALSRHR